MTAIQARNQINEKVDYNKLIDNREVQKPKFKLRKILRASDFKKLFIRGDSTNCSYKICTKTEVSNDTIPSYRIDYLPERYNQNLLPPTKLTLDGNN